MPRILLIEDDYQLLRLCTRLLQNAGYDVCPAAAYHAALDMFRLYGQFSLCISDIEVGAYDSMIMMKDLNHLREHYNTPMLFMSSHMERYRGVCEMLKIPFIEKPFPNQSLLDRVNDLVNKAAIS